MADFNALEALINAHIKKNGVQAITGNILNGILRGMVSALGKGYTIAGSASPATDPGTMTGPLAYIAYTAGTYTHFGGLEVEQGEVAMLIYNEAEWHKEVLFSLSATATIDGNVGTPEVGVSFVDGLLTFDFRNMKGNPGNDGDAAGFGTINATVDGNVGTPGVSVQTSGPDTAKNITFQFTNLKGETGVTSVVATVDNTVGTPTCTVSLVGQQLTLAFSGLKGAQGDTGSSVDYPFTIVNNLTTNDATQALSAAMGVELAGQVSQLEHKVSGNVAVINGGQFSESHNLPGDGIWRTDGSVFHLNKGVTYAFVLTCQAGNSTSYYNLYEYGGSALLNAISLPAATTIKEINYTPDRDILVQVGFRMTEVRPVTMSVTANSIGVQGEVLRNWKETQDGLYGKTATHGVVYEIGNVNMSNTGWAYGVSDKRVRIKDGYAVHLNPGDSFGLKDYTNAQYYWGFRDMAGNYTSGGWLSADRTTEIEGDLCLLVKVAPTEAVQTDARTLGELIKIVRNTTPAKLYDKVLDTEMTLVGNGSTSVSRDFKTTPGKTYDVLLPETEWSVEETTNTALVAFVLRTKSGSSYSDLASTRVYCSGFGMKRKLYSFQATTEISNVFIRADSGQELRFCIREQNNPSVIGDYILAKKNVERLDTMPMIKPYRFIHHLNVEIEEPIIPSQSLFDIAYARALGFKAIEANIKKCSDGVYVVKHGGTGGKLGAGLEFAEGSGLNADTTFSSVSSTDLRNYVTYASTMEKYRGHIPTLAEFCQACARLGMMPFLRGAEPDVLAEARKYLPDEQFVVEWTWTNRQDIKGMMTAWDSGATVDGIIAICERYGRPFTYSWSNTALNAASDELIEQVFQALHKKGYIVGTSYLQQNKYQQLRKKGLDVFVPTYKIIPPFYVGNTMNIVSGADEKLVYQNASYDNASDTIIMQNGGTIGVSDGKIGGAMSKACVRIRYNGTLNVKFRGSNNNENLVEYTSDGTEFIEVSVALEKVGADFLTIEATTETTIYDLSVFASVVM